MIHCLWKVYARRYGKKIGILREETKIWEMRTPLVPEDIRDLIRSHRIQFVVQPCNKRIFSNAEIESAGAVIDEDLTSCDLILGVKEVAIQNLIPHKRYLFFSHTHKGQSHNMPLLKEVLNRHITLHDYELMMNSNSSRCVAFGKYAGVAGMLTILGGLGIQLMFRGLRTPFLHLPAANHYKDFSEAKMKLKEIGAEIDHYGLPKEVAPLIIAITGQGNVSKGAQEVLNELPIVWVRPGELANVVKTPDCRRIIGCNVRTVDHIVEKSSKVPVSDPKMYYMHPQNFESNFFETVGPNCSVIVNGIYWDSRYPRLLQNGHLDCAKRLLSIADISCDINGSIEPVNRLSRIDNPFYYLNPKSRLYQPHPDQHSIQIMAVDNLPTQLPLDSSAHFSSQLKQFIPAFLDLEEGKNVKIARSSIIAEKGVLHKQFEAASNSLKRQKNVLILGSGYVVSPVVDFFKRNTHHTITVASKDKSFIGDLNHTINVEHDRDELASLVSSSDIVISLLPAVCHPIVAKICITHQKHMVTASYVSSEMHALDTSARSANVLIMNETGLDPGLDHLAAISCIADARRRGEEVKSFISWCGGLPMPEGIADNPFAYKFSWSPQGAIRALFERSRYMINGQESEISGEKLLDQVQRLDDLHPIIRFEGVPNRDSFKYIDLYGLKREYLQTIFRGTLRYPGYFDAMRTIFQNNAQLEGENLGLLTQISKFLGISSEEMKNRDILLKKMENALRYNPKEPDFVFMQHQFVFKGRDHERRVKIELAEIGDQATGGPSAMAKTVGIPVGIMAQLILEGQLKERGVCIPNEEYTVNIVLQRLKREGIHFKKTDEGETDDLFIKQEDALHLSVKQIVG